MFSYDDKRFRGFAAARVLLACVGLAACNGTAVVTLTATASTDTFLAYRVGLVSVDLNTSNGKSSTKALPSRTTVDLAKLVSISEVVGSAAGSKADYNSVVVTLDYSAAEIVYDNGTPNGLVLAPLVTGGKAAGLVTLTLNLDPADPLDVATGKLSRLALDFKLGATNVVDATAQTVTVTPMMAASASPTDAKLVRIRGPLALVDTTDTRFTTNVAPFDFPTLGAGQFVILPSDTTTYQVNGAAYTGVAGLSQMAALAADAMTVTLGTLASTTSSTTTTAADGTTTTSTSSNLSFSATEVLAGTSASSASFDRISGVITARSGNTFIIEDATLVAIDGSNTFLAGSATVTVGPNTLVNLDGQGGTELNTVQQLSVGSFVRAFGAATAPVSGNATLDASAGLVELGLTTASGLVTTQDSGAIELNLTSLGGRSVTAFDFVGTPADPATYVVSTGALDLTNATAGAPVEVSGLAAAFGTGSPDYTASTLLDPTTISAQLVLDWGAGTATPFSTYDTSAIDVNSRNAAIGARHSIQQGAQSINIVGLASDPLITPGTDSTLLFAIGHAASGTVENFISYAAFITALQTELNGTVLATGLTATGVYTASTFSLSAGSVTLMLNN
jgi:hypothetical protein